MEMVRGLEDGLKMVWRWSQEGAEMVRRGCEDVKQVSTWFEESLKMMKMENRSRRDGEPVRNRWRSHNI